MRSKIIFAALLFASVSVFGQAQTGFSGAKIGVGLNGGMPFGNAGKVYSFLAGGLASIEYPLKSNLSLTGSLGYSRLSYKKEFRDLFDGLGVSTSTGVVPLKGGVKLPLNSNVYTQGELGLAIGDGTSFILSPRIGYEKPLSKGSLAASARYELWSNQGSIHLFALGLEYNFSLK